MAETESSILSSVSLLLLALLLAINFLKRLMRCLLFNENIDLGLLGGFCFLNGLLTLQNLQFDHVYTSFSKVSNCNLTNKQLQLRLYSNITIHGRHGPFQVDMRIHDKLHYNQAKSYCSIKQQVMPDIVHFKRTRTSMSKLHQVKATAYSNITIHGRHGPFQADTHIHE